MKFLFSSVLFLFLASSILAEESLFNVQDRLIKSTTLRKILDEEIRIVSSSLDEKPSHEKDYEYWYLVGQFQAYRRLIFYIDCPFMYEN